MLAWAGRGETTGRLELGDGMLLGDESQRCPFPWLWQDLDALWHALLWTVEVI
jgi:hypothetical protein